MNPPPQPLPPALARLASALELSSGFLLYFITGPRDHADSVFIRLRVLESDFEVVRHQIFGTEDLDLSDVLAGGDTRPRIVFISGLERMDTAKRRELSERLNLLRDAWAPSAARVIFWLPSWGLAEFRRIAPDLFDWRSGLITLSDADLPIRDEREYVIWACERHGGARWAIGGPREWPSRRRWLDHLPHRVVFSDLDPAERSTMVRDVTVGFARDTLIHATLGDRGRDLLLSSSQRKSPVPVLIRSQDAAGKLDGDGPPWLSLARGAGIPGPDAAASVLAALAAESRLLVVLDGFDQLGLDAGEAPRRWLERLVNHDPPLWLLATTIRPAEFFATWPRAPFETLGIVDADDGPAREHLDLIRLIQRLFPGHDDLTRLSNYMLGAEADELPSDDTPLRIATRFVLACARRGLLDASFFAELTRMRPAHATEIEAVARSLADA